MKLFALGAFIAAGLILAPWLVVVVGMLALWRCMK
jgi:hypothetical protein